jgi:hypothetical protein
VHLTADDALGRPVRRRDKISDQPSAKREWNRFATHQSDFRKKVSDESMIATSEKSQQFTPPLTCIHSGRWERSHMLVRLVFISRICRV